MSADHDGSVGYPAAMLGGIGEDQFLATYWRRRYLHIPGGAAHLLPVMPDRQEVCRLLDAPTFANADLAQVISFPEDGEPVARAWSLGVGRSSPRDPTDPVNVLAADHWFPSLRPLAAGLAAGFGSPASLQLFLGTPGRGLNPHRDQNDSFVIQIAGSKRWLVADITDDRPAVSGMGGADLPPDPIVFDLEPGDVLYKPSHSVHTTVSGEESTLSLTCSIVTRTAGDLVLDVLRERMAADPAWLERFPTMHGTAGSDDDPAAPRVERALGQLREMMPTAADLAEAVRWS